jgi:hypothetical protein
MRCAAALEDGLEIMIKLARREWISLGVSETAEREDVEDSAAPYQHSRGILEDSKEFDAKCYKHHAYEQGLYLGLPHLLFPLRLAKGSQDQNNQIDGGTYGFLVLHFEQTT